MPYVRIQPERNTFRWNIWLGSSLLFDLDSLAFGLHELGKLCSSKALLVHMVALREPFDIPFAN